MLDTLPCEVLHIIIHHLSILGCFNQENEDDNHDHRPRLDLHTKCFTGFSTWNYVIDTQSLLSLAHTCRYLKAAVYPVVYRTIACANHNYKDPDFYADMNLFVFTRGNEDQHNRAITTQSVPQFYHLADYATLSKDALQYVRRLYVATGCPPFRPWFGKVLPHMTSLQEVMLSLGAPCELENVHVFGALLKHKNRPRVHAIFDYPWYDVFLFPFSTRSETEWSDFCKLNVESLDISYYHEKHEFPQSFFEMIRGFTSLKRLKLYGRHNDDPEFPEMKSPGSVSMYHIATLLQDLKNLQHLDYNLPPSDLKWPKLVHLTKLSAPLWAFEVNRPMDTFDSVTHLELLRQGFPSRVCLPFRNLKTLALLEAHSGAPKTLEVLVEMNPGLVNLSLQNCAMPLPLHTLDKLMSQLERLDVHGQGPLEFFDILRRAKRLQHFYYAGIADEDYVSMAQVMHAVWRNQISPDLQIVQVDPRCFWSSEPDPNPMNYIRQELVETVPLELVDLAVKPVCPVDRSKGQVVVIDLEAMRACCDREKARQIAQMKQSESQKNASTGL